MKMPEPRQESLAKRDRVIIALREIVPGEGVIATEDALRAYECDGLSAYRALPLAVVLPSTTDQVSEILRFCDLENIHVVPRGAGTSLSGGALPVTDGIVLGLGKFNKIQNIDYQNRRPSPASPISGSPMPCSRRAFITHPTLHRRSPARSVAISPKIQAGCTA